jgi:hypothetical protein
LHLTQGQGNGKFTSSEASALIDQLLGEDPGASDVVVNDGPAVEAKKGPVEGSSDVVTLGVETRQPGKPIRAARTSEPTDCRDSAPGGRRRADSAVVEHLELNPSLWETTDSETRS